MMNRILVFLMGMLFFPLAALAEGQLYVVMGFGQVKVESRGLTWWDASKSQELETDLLISEQLAGVVTGKQEIAIQVLESEMGDLSENSSQAMNSVKRLVTNKALASLEAQRAEKEDSGGEGLPGRQYRSGDDRVVVGSNIDIGLGEELEEVVVVAGNANIHGTVKRLVVVGGRVHLFSTAKITEELNVVGGQVEKEPGAQILGKKVEVSMPLGQSSWQFVWDSMDGQPFGDFFTSIWGQTFFFVLKIIVLMILAYFGFLLAPMFQAKTLMEITVSPLKNFGWGILSTVLILPITLILCLTIIGIPFLPLQFSLLCIFSIYGYIQVGHSLSGKLIERMNPQVKLNFWWLILLGLVLLGLLDLVPVVGSWMVALLSLVGFGAANKVFIQKIFANRKKAKGPVDPGPSKDPVSAIEGSEMSKG